MKTKREVFNVGDRVKITNAEIFERVGYPFTLDYAIKNLVTPEDHELITKLAGMREDRVTNKIYNQIERTVAYKRLRQAGFGGRERKLYTRLDNTYRNELATVVSKRVVRTGKYYSAHSSTDYWGEYDYEPAGLENAKSHIILGLQLDKFNHLLRVGDLGDLQIEAKNVVKISE